LRKSKSRFSKTTGGDIQSGQVIGSTNKHGKVPSDRPVKFQELFATLSHILGLDAHAIGCSTGRARRVIRWTVLSSRSEICCNRRQHTNQLESRLEKGSAQLFSAHLFSASLAA
jgi:hypothetical protein